MKSLIVIPCYNHGDLCNSLISKIINKDILIIDDGSDTQYFPENSKNISILRNDKNTGKGYSIKKAALFAIENNYEKILVIDADLQHNPKYIDSFLKNTDFDLVYGRRSFNKEMPVMRRVSNIITSFLISIITKQKIKDTQCGYRLYNLNLFKELDSKEDGYQFESEILLKKINIKSKIKSVKISTIYNDSKSHINNFKDTYKFIKLILRNIIW